MLAMLARMSWAGCAGQVRLAGYAFIFCPVVVAVVVVVVVFVVVVVVVGVLLLSLLLFLGFVRWFLDASFHVTFLRILVILERDTVIFGSQNLSFGRPCPSVLHLGGPWDDPGAPGSKGKETLGSRLGFVSILD